jgi:hypothetical protein
MEQPDIRIITEYQEYLRISKSETVEIPLVANTYRYQFPILQNLKNALVTGMEAFSSAEMTYTPTNQPVIVAADYNRSYLQLSNPFNRIEVDNIPLYSLKSFPGFLRLLDYKDVDWQNCFINIGNPTPAVPLTVPSSLLFTVYYIDKQSKDVLKKKLQEITAQLNKTN